MLKDVVHLFFPQTCIGCANALYRNEEQVCLKCEADLPYAENFNLIENKTTKVLAGRIKIATGFSLFDYSKEGKVQSFLQKMKYGDNAKVCQFFGEQIGFQLNQFDVQYDFIVPVPLHPIKYKQRGYNQSKELALGLIKSSESKLASEAVIRTHNNTSQVKKSRSERWKNVDSIFAEGTKIADLKNKHIAVIDDVITTGATIEAMCSILEKVEGIKISIITLAIA